MILGVILPFLWLFGDFGPGYTFQNNTKVGDGQVTGTVNMLDPSP